MNQPLSFVVRTTLFFAITGGVVGMLAILPFADQILVHQSIWGSKFIPIFFLGYFVFALPVAGLAGLVFSTLRYSFFKLNKVSVGANLLLGFLSGVAVGVFFVLAGDFRIVDDVWVRFWQIAFLALNSAFTAWLYSCWLHKSR